MIKWLFPVHFFQFEESIPCFQKSLEINSLQVGVSSKQLGRKNLKLVQLQSLVAKCCKVRKI